MFPFYDKYPSDDVEGMAKYVSFDELIARSDIISLHAPLTDENYHMLNAETFRNMKDGL